MNDRFLDEVKANFDADLTRLSTENEKADLLLSIQSFSFPFIKEAAQTPTHAWTITKNCVDLLWYMFIETAKTLGKDDLYQDKLLLLLQWTREFNKLHCTTHPAEVIEGTVWETYGFSEKLYEAWEQLVAVGNVEQQVNLANFSAKALATGVCPYGLRRVASWFLREALETKDDARTIVLLPAAVMWINLCCHALLASSVMRIKSNATEREFHLDRWLLWRQRLQHLSKHPDHSVSEQAKKGFMRMISCGKDLGIEVPGEATFGKKLQTALYEELLRSGKNSVDGDEIDIDVDWVDEV